MRVTPRRQAGPWVLALFWLAGGAAATAQQSAPAAPSTDDTALARQLFEDGVSAMDQGKFDAAEDNFRRVLALKDTAVVRYNLASALTELGQLVEAREHLHNVVANESTAPELRSAARERHAELEPRIARLTVRLLGDEEDVVIRVGERTLPIEALDVPAPVDPGEHRVTATRADKLVAVATVVVGEGKSQELTLALPDAPKPPQPSSSVVGEPALLTATPKDDGKDDGGDLLQSPWFWSGLGVVSVAAVVVVVLVAGGEQSDPVEGSAGLVKVGMP